MLKCLVKILQFLNKEQCTCTCTCTNLQILLKKRCPNNKKRKDSTHHSKPSLHVDCNF